MVAANRVRENPPPVDQNRTLSPRALERWVRVEGRHSVVEGHSLPPAVAPTVLPSLAFEGKHALKTGVLTVSCEDSAGIIGTVTSFLHMHGANIEDCRTHSTPGNVFTMRVQFALPEHWLGVVREAFEVMIAAPYGMRWALKWEDEVKRVAVLCTKEDH
eukprot:CAMPEP_0177765324 /NCGR_PEP_ID=MMETSP0491_2-20121128/7933_1 /TAXON_ID=63592 /ORGANISM="Tetraselmis chuii, Strain PLY429" /LENGTH=158 /DNA_ID=CAMNT_0019281669 /DNA_START=19 /DNA_END=492 /DNA_ORIENTATION=-